MNNDIKRNNYIEERIWRHILNWLIYLILPFTCIDIAMFLILIEKHNDNTILWIMFIFILCGTFIVLRILLKEAERLIDDLKSKMMNKEKISKWFLYNFKVRTDWTGSYVETEFKYDNVEDMIDKFIRDNFK